MRARIPSLAVVVWVSCGGCGTEDLVMNLPGEFWIVSPWACDVVQDPPAGSTVVEIDPGGLTYCPPHVRGDRDFKGHGPCVNLTAEVCANTEANTLEVHVYMRAEEWQDGRPKSDHTTASGWSWSWAVRAPDGMRMVGLAQGQETTFWHSYVDRDHQDDVFAFPAVRLVGMLVYTGDTGGDDAGVATGVTVRFNPVRVVVVEE